jgi:hypothetical protein
VAHVPNTVSVPAILPVPGKHGKMTYWPTAGAAQLVIIPDKAFSISTEQIASVSDEPAV